MEQSDEFIERIADAVVRRIDEREKINLLAQVVLDRLAELQRGAAAAAEAAPGLDAFVTALAGQAESSAVAV
jgi:hypothetical protein